MALSFVFLDFLNDAFDSILKRKSILFNILIEEEAIPLVNSTVVQNNKEKLTNNSRGISRGPGRGRVNLPASRNCGKDLESGLPAASGNSVELGHARGRCVRGLGVRGRGVRGSFNGRSGNSVVPASQKIEEWFDYFVNTWFEGEFPPSMWNHSNTVGPRTNNHVEGYHHKINNWINKQHPDIYSLINVNKKMDSLMVVDYNKRVCGEKSPKRNKLDLQKEDKLYFGVIEK
jgi:hypothetical protein